MPLSTKDAIESTKRMILHIDRIITLIQEIKNDLESNSIDTVSVSRQLNRLHNQNRSHRAGI